MNKTAKLEQARDLLNARLKEHIPPDAIVAELDALLAPLKTATGDTTPMGLVQPGAMPAQAGPWQLHDALGIGGMGIVYQATRIDQPEQIAALKVIRSNRLDFCQAFERERRIVARLNHPNIPHFLDAGFLSDGRPWLAMEYVEGVSILDYCKDQKLDFKARLKLFLRICDALSHAHQNMIIHRDIKPNNILIDTRGEPKLLDFGIAHTMDPQTLSPGEQADTTMLTPEYAAPEQVRNQSLNAATDVYSLGILLYECITGARPYEVRGSPQEMTDAICEAPIVAPSKFESGETCTVIPRIYRSDFDLIIQKALSRDRKIRYASARELSDDIIHMLRGRPVAAHEGTVPYRMAKFVLRHTWGVVGMSSFCIALILFAWAMAHQRDLIELERQKVVAEHEVSDSVADFMISLFEEANPDGSRGDQLTAKEVLDQGYQRVTKDLDKYPPIQARLQLAMAETYLAIGEFDKAGPLLDQAAKYYDTLKEPSPKRVTLLQAQAEFRIHRGDIEGGLSLANQARKMAETLKDPKIVAKALLLEGSFLGKTGDLGGAEILLRKGLEGQTKIFGKDHPKLRAGYNQLGYNLHLQQRFAEAIPYFEQCIAICNDNGDSDYSSMAIYQNNLALAFRRMGHTDKAMALLDKALDGFERHWGPIHYHTAAVLGNLALIHTKEGRYEKAQHFYDKALAVNKEVYGPNHPNTAKLLANIAWMHRLEGQMDMAERTYREALTTMRHSRGDQHSDTMAITRDLSRFYFLKGDIEAAEILAKRYLDFYSTQGSIEYPQMLSLLAYDLVRIGQKERAIPYLKRFQDLDFDSFPPVPFSDCIHMAGRAFYRMEDYEAAVAIYKKGVALREKHLGRSDAQTLRSMNNLGLAYLMKGDVKLGKALLDENFRARANRYPADNSRLASAAYNLAFAHYMSGAYDQALVYLNKARPGYDKHFRRDKNRQTNLLALTTAAQAQLGNTQGAESILLKAYSEISSEEFHVPQHPKIIARYLVDYYRKIQRPHDAEPWIPKAIPVL